MPPPRRWTLEPRRLGSGGIVPNHRPEPLTAEVGIGCLARGRSTRIAVHGNLAADSFHENVNSVPRQSAATVLDISNFVPLAVPA